MGASTLLGLATRHFKLTEEELKRIQETNEAKKERFSGLNLMLHIFVK